MKFYISKLYIWFARGVHPRILTFDNNKVNVITGSSSTGKSNIYSIIDYCLLSARPNIVEPVINEHARWYGLEFSVNDKLYAIARKKPTIEASTPDCYLQYEPFSEGFYPQNTNTHINDGRFILEKAFGYNKSGNRHLYRSCFVFNALTESIITSPYEFLNYKFYGEEYYQEPENRRKLLESVLTPDAEGYVKARNEKAKLDEKKKRYERYCHSLSNQTKEFQELLNTLVQSCISVGLLDPDILSEPDQRQIEAIENILQANNLTLEERKNLDKKMEELQKLHLLKNLQLTNVNRSQSERETYANSLSQIADSLKPVELLYERAARGNTTMWTSHIISALRESLEKITISKEHLEGQIAPDNTLKESLQKALESIDAQISSVTRQQGSLYQQSESFKVIGKLDANISRLKELWRKKQKKVQKGMEPLTEAERKRLTELTQMIQDFEHDRLTTIPNLNDCIQHIYDDFQYMEHYEDCYTKYDWGQERLVLNDGKSIINYETIGSQSNYMFLHLCFFMGLHRYFFEYIEQRHVGQFLFIDQPSIPYYAGSEDVKTTDKDKLLDAFKSINDFMEYVIEEKQEQFQVILIEHAPESYWTGDNHLEYFVTKEQFTDGNALIPQYVLNPIATDED